MSRIGAECVVAVAVAAVCFALGRLFGIVETVTTVLAAHP